MPRVNFTSERYQVFRLLQDLDRGVVHHTAWLRDLHRNLICEGSDALTPDLAHDAHLRCRFGRWYAAQPVAMHDEPQFAEIGQLHEEMHDAARDMLAERLREGAVKTGSYTQFMDVAIHFKLSVRQFQAYLVEQVCVVDQLTGAWNRHAMHYRLAQEQERMNRRGGRCCLCMVDIDNFKQVNDRYGHPVGDLVLRDVASILSRLLRKYDSVFRYGGEEFLLCLPGLELDSSAQLMERLRLEIEMSAITVPGAERPLQVTASFGIACLSPGEEMESALAEADHALMWAKADGRNCVRVWDGEPRSA